MTQLASDEQMIGNETYLFDAIRGIQAGREFYVAMCHLKIIPKLFSFNDYDLPPELRAQRTLRESRIPEIKNYILQNPDSYIFSSLTASVDGKMKFIPAPHLGEEGRLGRLFINMESRLLINDGQHRKKAIEEALRERPELGYEMISVVFFQDQGLERSQQMFSDLNKNVVKPTKSLNILYDHRDEFSRFIVNLVNSIEIFEGKVDLEKTSLSNRSRKVFTLNGVADATKKLLGRNKIQRISKQEKEDVKLFWDEVSKNIPEWQLLLDGKISAFDIRKNYVHGNTNLLNALGIMGNILLKEYPDNWKEKLRGLRDIDWLRSSPTWDGNLIVNKQMVKSTLGIELAANTLLKKCGIELPEKRKKYEEKR